MRKWLIGQQVDEKGGMEEEEEGNAAEEDRSFKMVNNIYLCLTTGHICAVQLSIM